MHVIGHIKIMHVIGHIKITRTRRRVALFDEMIYMHLLDILR